MVEKSPAVTDAKKSRANEHEKHKQKNKLPEQKSDPVAVDRPGFDLGGSTGKTSAGTGLGTGQDASESRSGRRLPGRRGKSK